MKVIIAGSREITDYDIVKEAFLLSKFEASEIVSGAARGVDQLGEMLAKSLNIDIKRFPADWNKYGKRAGYLRNAEMAKYADALIAVWDGKSKGTENMISQATKNNLLLYIHIFKDAYE